MSTLKRSQQATTFTIMRKAVKVDGEEIKMSSVEIYQRLLSISCINGPPDPTVFSHELSSVSPFLFQDDGSMR